MRNTIINPQEYNIKYIIITALLHCRSFHTCAYLIKMIFIKRLMRSFWNTINWKANEIVEYNLFISWRARYVTSVHSKRRPGLPIKHHWKLSINLTVKIPIKDKKDHVWCQFLTSMANFKLRLTVNENLHSSQRNYPVRTINYISIIYD